MRRLDDAVAARVDRGALGRGGDAPEQEHEAARAATATRAAAAAAAVALSPVVVVVVVVAAVLAAATAAAAGGGGGGERERRGGLARAQSANDGVGEGLPPRLRDRLLHDDTRWRNV